MEYKNYLKCGKQNDLIKCESKLLELLKTGYGTVSGSNKIEILFLLQLIDFFHNEIQFYLNDSSFYSKYLKDSNGNLFLNLFTQSLKFNINLCYLIFIDTNMDLISYKFIKNNFYKILIIFYSIEKLFEFFFKASEYDFKVFKMLPEAFLMR